MQNLLKRTRLLLLGTCLLAGLSSSAQSLSGQDIKDQLTKDWERAKGYTLEYLQALPANLYSYKAVDSIRSFAQLMLHLAQGNIGLVSNATGQARLFPGWNLEKSTTAQTKDSVVYYVTRSYDFVLEGIKGLDPAKYGETINVFNHPITRYACLLKAFEHQTHERGQTTIYIRLLGIRPPGEKLF